jgi:antibiotic biosynthesis monooxygenase (ABM) superfamily enzyme
MSDQNTSNRKPKLWKMLLIAWVYAYVLINIVFAVLGPFLVNLIPFIRSMVITTLLVPAMGLGIPFIQIKLYKWTIK